MAPSVEYIERAFQDAREGRPALRPFSDSVIPTTFDKTLAPEGVHIMSLFTQWVPHEWADEPHKDELEAYADRMVDCYDEVAPGFRSSIMHRDIVGPHEMQEEYGLVGGNIFHGELSLEQLFHMRPGARLRRLPHAGQGPVQRQLGHPRRRRCLRHPRLPGGACGAVGPQVGAQPAAAGEVTLPLSRRATAHSGRPGRPRHARGADGRDRRGQHQDGVVRRAAGRGGRRRRPVRTRRAGQPALRRGRRAAVRPHAR